MPAVADKSKGKAAPAPAVRDYLVPERDPSTKTIRLYNARWPEAMFPSQLQVELFMLRFYGTERTKGFKSPGKFHHLKNVIDLWWNVPQSQKHFDWQTYSEKMARAACEHDYLAIAGAASTGKSDFAAVYALAQLMASPTETLILITSTSLKGARGRVWASMRKYFQARPGIPAKLIDSAGLIRVQDPTGKIPTNDQMGITLIAADPAKSTEASAKMIGLHQTRVFLIADELSELSDSVMKSVSNLAANPHFQMIGLSNPRSRFDPMGTLAEPEAGWESINIETPEWKTKLGYAIRLDGKDSPNIVQGETVYPYLLTQAQWEAAVARGGVAGENSSGFLRMVRGWFPDSVADEAIYSEMDFSHHKAYDKPVWGVDAPIKVCGCDPSFAGGDRTALVFGAYGKDINGVPIFSKTETLLVSDDATKKHIPASQQIAQKIVDECKARGVQPRHFAIDSTGGGAPLADIIATLWSNELMRVQFSASPSDNPVSPVDPTPAKDAFTNKVSELWCCGVDLLRAGQVRGIDKELAKELSSRYYDNKRGGAKRCVESKQVMKSRVGYSPDIADAWCVALDLVRNRLRMVSRSKGGPVSGGAGVTWKKVVRKYSPVLTHGALQAE